MENIRGNINGVLQDIIGLSSLIAFSKMNHYLSGLSKDLGFMKELSFGLIDPVKAFLSKFNFNATHLDVDNIFNFVKDKNPISHRIRSNYHFNTGTTIFSTLNVMSTLTVIMLGECNDEDYILKLISDNSVRRAKKEIVKLCGKGVDKDDTEKFIYEYLEIIKAVFNGRNYHTLQSAIS